MLFVDSPRAAVAHHKGCTLFKSGSFLASSRKLPSIWKLVSKCRRASCAITKERFVATEIVVVDRLAAERGRTFQEHPARFFRPSELVQTKTSVQETRAALRRDATKFSAESEGTVPALADHQVMKPQLQDFRDDPAMLLEWH